MSPTDPSKAGELGMYYFNAAVPLAAASCFKYAAGLEPKAVRWRYYLGLAQKSAYNAAEATASFEAARALDPNYAPILVEIGEQRIKTDIESARRLYQQAAKLSPREPRAHFGLGECARLRRDLAAAIPEYEIAIELAPAYGEAHQSLALCLEASGKKSEAARHRELLSVGRAPPVSQDPLLLDLLSRSTGGLQLLHLARALTGAGQIEQAIETLQTAVEKDERDLTARGALGLLFDMTGQNQEAVQQFRMILTHKPNDFTALLNLANALTNADESEEAEKYYEEVLSSEPNNSRAVSLYAWHLLRRGRSVEAGKYFERLVQLKPEDPESHFSFAVGLVCLQRQETAVDQYRRAVMLKSSAGDLFPRFLSKALGAMMQQQAVRSDPAATTAVPKLLIEFANALDLKQMPAEATAARVYRDVLLKQAIAAARIGKHADALGFVRLTLADEGKKGDAEVVQQLKKAVTVKPKDVAVQHLLAIVFLDIDDPTGAKNEWRKLVSKEPKYVLAYIGWALEMLREKDFVEARRILEDGLKRVPESPWLANALAWVLATAPDVSQRKGPEAVQWAIKACAATGHKNPVLLDTLAAAHAAAGNFTEAEKIELDAIKLANNIGQTSFISVYRKRLILYEKKQPYVQTWETKD